MVEETVQPASKHHFHHRGKGKLYTVPLPLLEGGALWMLWDFLHGSGAFFRTSFYYTNAQLKDTVVGKLETAVIPEAWRKRSLSLQFRLHLPRQPKSENRTFWEDELRMERSSPTLEACLQVLHGPIRYRNRTLTGYVNRKHVTADLRVYCVPEPRDLSQGNADGEITITLEDLAESNKGWTFDWPALADEGLPKSTNKRVTCESLLYLTICLAASVSLILVFFKTGLNVLMCCQRSASMQHRRVPGLLRASGGV